MTESPPGQFQVTNREVQTAIPFDSTEMSIRCMDWKRIRRKISNLPSGISSLKGISSFSCGIFISAAFTLVPLYQSNVPTEQWVKTTFIVAAVVSLITAIVTFILGREKGEMVKMTKEEILKDMSEIDETFFPQSKQVSQGKVDNGAT